jgi:hypothetical protein
VRANGQLGNAVGGTPPQVTGEPKFVTSIWKWAGRACVPPAALTAAAQVSVGP